MQCCCIPLLCQLSGKDEYMDGYWLSQPSSHFPIFSFPISHFLVPTFRVTRATLLFKDSILKCSTLFDPLSTLCRWRVRDFVRPTGVGGVSLSAVSWSGGRGDRVESACQWVYAHVIHGDKFSILLYACCIHCACWTMVSGFIHWALQNTKSSQTFCRQTGSFVLCTFIDWCMSLYISELCNMCLP